jgi:hypothetical protein
MGLGSRISSSKIRIEFNKLKKLKKKICSPKFACQEHLSNKMSGLGLALYGNNAAYVRYFDDRRHIWVERNDNAAGVEKVQAWIDQNDLAPDARTPEEARKRYDFVFHHIKETTGIFEWYFKESMFTKP